MANNDGIVLFPSSSNNTIRYNNISDSFIGIYLSSNSNSNSITGNNVSRNKYEGVLLYRSNNNHIMNNTIIENPGNGIVVGYSNNNNITNNIISNNNQSGILFYDITTESETISNNIRENEIFSNSEHGIFCRYANFNNISYNNISKNLNDGIYFYVSYNNNLTDNDIWANMDGINISSSSEYNIVINNNISSNTGNGTRIDSSSSNNFIYHNNFLDNANQAYDEGSNIWNLTYPYGGNYWSDFDEVSEGAYDDYRGQNQDVVGSDGIVDNGSTGGGGKNPYIGSGNQDDYPLMKPYPNKLLENHTILKQGWNLVSIPLIQEEQNLTRVLGSIDGYYDAVQWYDSSNPIDSWKHNKIGKQFGNDLSELNETMSFWIHITNPGDTIFVYNGTVPTSNQTIQLHPGWNMVGYPSLSSHNRTTGLNNLTFDTHVDCIQWYDAGTKTWHFMGPDDSFVPGIGYWVHSKVDVEWEVPL
jgi:parallel beta-helix repeat protein